MRKVWLVGGLALVGIGAVVAWRRLTSSGYEEDEIDFAGEEGDFGERSGAPPEATASPAETRSDATAEELSMAARVETSIEDIRTVWPSVSLDDIRKAEGNLDSLAGLIAEKVEQPRDEVKKRLEAILAQDTPDPSYPAH